MHKLFIWDLGSWPLYRGGFYSGVAVKRIEAVNVEVLISNELKKGGELQVQGRDIVYILQKASIREKSCVFGKHCGFIRIDV